MLVIIYNSVVEESKVPAVPGEASEFHREEWRNSDLRSGKQGGGTGQREVFVLPPGIPSTLSSIGHIERDRRQTNAILIEEEETMVSFFGA